MSTIASPGADTITFEVTGTITLTSAGLGVSGSVTIDGPGANALTISGNRTNRILATAPGSVLDIRDLTLANGSAGGSGGGAILNTGATVRVADSAFVRNSAFAGGAIQNVEGGTLTITRSTFVANSGLPGGAIANFGVSATSPSTVNISNTTFAENTAGIGGAIHNLRWGNVRATNSTFSGNLASSSMGGAVHNQGDRVTLENSIFAGNGCEGFDIVDGGGNLDWPASGCPGINADPKLGPLAYNGGLTQTMAIGLGGGAIDTALAAVCPSTDQRGVSRPQGGGCDIGAFESDAVDTTPPVITAPGGIAVDATGPAGAVVAYSASAIDDVDGSVEVTCSHQPGSSFPIGTTHVTCGASDAAGNEARASFDVHVKGAGEQLDELIDRVNGIGPGSSLTDKLIEAESALAGGKATMACDKLEAFANQAQAQSGKTLTPAVAAELAATAKRIRSVLSC